jgi:hypothetical protein
MPNNLIVPTAGAILVQRISVAAVRAGISSIPFAALAWDVVAASLDFVNGRAADSFLDELGARVEKMELANGGLSGPARIAAHEALQRLMYEESEDYARDLAGALAAIEESDEDPRFLAQVAAALGQMSSRYRVYLGVISRFQSHKPTEKEVALVGEVGPFPTGTFGDTDNYDVLFSLEYVLSKHYPSASISTDLAALKGIGLITVPSVRLVGREPEPWKLIPVRLTNFGESVLSAFTDDPNCVPVYSDLF